MSPSAVLCILLEYASSYLVWILASSTTTGRQVIVHSVARSFTMMCMY